MAKLFPIIPEFLSDLVPDSPNYDDYDNWGSEPTFDEDGLLHSFNDAPIFVNEHFRETKSGKSLGSQGRKPSSDYHEFRWYSHGNISRADNMPPVVLISTYSYSTSNENKELHSYNGMPAHIANNFISGLITLYWYENGLSHKDGGLPASIIYDWEGNVKAETFYVDGLQHRGNNLPSDIGSDDKTWRVLNVLHNSLGFAQAYIEEDGSQIFKWCLYGVEMPEAVFGSTMKLVSDKGIPLYAAFLVSMRIITLEHLNIFVDASGKWKIGVPLLWVFRSLNVTSETFNRKILGAVNWNAEIHFAYTLRTPEKRFQSFQDIICFEETEGLLSRV